MNFFKKLIGITDKVSETALDVGRTLRSIEDLKRDITALRGKTLTTEIVLSLLADLDAIQQSIEAVRK